MNGADGGGVIAGSQVFKVVFATMEPRETLTVLFDTPIEQKNMFVNFSHFGVFFRSFVCMRQV